MKRLCVYDKSNDVAYAYISGTSRVFTVTLLKPLKMEALIPVPADCEVQSVMSFNAQNIALIEIHHTEEIRVQILVLTKLIGFLFLVSLSHDGKFCAGFTFPRSI